MAPQGGRERTGLIAELFRAPYRFGFFQAVRLLEHRERERTRDDPDRRRKPVGHDDPKREVVGFRALPSLGFPAGEVSQLDEPANAPAPEMTVTFLGMTGPSGVLPRHYTELMLERLRFKDTTLRDFFDLFHHRLISLFYRAWEKYRLPITYERARLDTPEDDPGLVAQGLYSLVGLGTPGLRRRLDVDDEIFLYYSGHFAHRPRSALALECLLGDYLDATVEVQQLQGQWLELDPDDLAVLPGPGDPAGRNNQLGISVVVGERVWDIQSKFRLRIVTPRWSQFRSLMPDGDRLRRVCQVTRLYVGPDLDFDVQPVLSPEAVPWCQLSAESDPGPRLGWNTWIRTEPHTRPVDDAVFSGPDLGNTG